MCDDMRMSCLNFALIKAQKNTKNGWKVKKIEKLSSTPERHNTTPEMGNCTQAKTKRAHRSGYCRNHWPQQTISSQNTQKTETSLDTTKFTTSSEEDSESDGFDPYELVRKDKK